MTGVTNTENNNQRGLRRNFDENPALEVVTDVKYSIQFLFPGLFNNLKSYSGYLLGFVENWKNAIYF